MSIIHDALKKAQSEREVAAFTPYINDRKRDAHISRSSSNVKVILVLLSLLVGIVGSWIAIYRVGFNNITQAIFKKKPSQVQTRAVENKSNKSAALSKKEGEVMGRSAMVENQEIKDSNNKRFEDAKYRNLKGMEFYKHGKYSLAKGEFLASIEVFPEYAEAYNNAGLAYKKLGDSKNAEANYKKALKYKTDYPEALNNYGVLLESNGDTIAAKEYFKKAIAAAPYYPAPYLNLAVALEKDKKFDEAIVYYEKFLSYSKQNNEPVSNDIERSIRERMLYLNTDNLTLP